MSTDRFLIVNADDFGLSEGINSGILECYNKGIVTSTSLMVRWPSARQAAIAAKNNPDLSVGLHFDAGEWFFTGSDWKPIYEVVDLRDIRLTIDELHRQLAQFYDLIGRNPTHIDSHQHVHRSEPLLAAFRRVGTDLKIPVRHAVMGVRYIGSFYGQTENGESAPRFIDVDAMVQYIADLKPGVSEMCCHPGYPQFLTTMYREERVLEIETLCHPKVNAEIARQQIRLCSFADIDFESVTNEMSS